MFENIIGNEKVKEYLSTTIKNNNISHSYMFVGKPGIGKKLFAKEYAKAIMCNSNNKCDTLNKCDSCIKFDGNCNPDYGVIIPDNNLLRVDQIRDFQMNISEKPIVSKRKVYVIDDAVLMNEASQNCLLKTLEEPPEYAVIILIVSNESILLPTIKSRCISVKFNDLSKNEIKKFKPDLTDDLIEILDGSLEKIDVIEGEKEKYQELYKLTDALVHNTMIDVYNKADVLYNNREMILQLLEYLNIIFLKEKILEPMKIIEKTKRKIEDSNNYDMSIDYMLMNIWEDINDKNSRNKI